MPDIFLYDTVESVSIASTTDWDGLHDHLRDVPWEDVFGLGALLLLLLLLLVNFVSGFRLELIYIYIPHKKYQVKPHSSPWSSAACASAIVHRNHLFRLYQREKSSDSKVKFSYASNRCRRVFEACIC